MTKFLIICESTAFLEGEIRDDDVADKIVWRDDPYMSIVECHHSDIEDNMVSIETTDGDEYQFLRDVDGDLHYILDYMSKQDVVNGFERRSGT